MPNTPDIEMTKNQNMQSVGIVPGSVIPYMEYRTHLSRYAFIAKFASGKDVLEIGCGTGYGASYLLRKGAKKVAGIDISDEALEVAKAHFERPGLKYAKMNGEGLTLPENSFDIVISFGVIDHVEHPELLLSECNR